MLLMMKTTTKTHGSGLIWRQRLLDSSHKHHADAPKLELTCHTTACIKLHTILDDASQRLKANASS
eukprot:6457574-Amphidinium_carterae.1